MKAEVKLSTGRFYLEIAGVILAMQGDPCRDPNIMSRGWEVEDLKEAARRINESNLEP